MVASWLNAGEVDRATIHQDSSEKAIARFWDQKASGRTDLDWPFLYQWAVEDYEIVGVTTWLIDEDAEKSRDYFKKGAEVGIDLLNLRRGIPGKGHSDQETRVVELALAVRDLQLAQKAAGLLLAPEDYQYGHPTGRIYAGVLRSVLLEDIAKFEHYLAKLETATRRPPYQQFGRMFQSLLSGDIPMVEKEFKQYLRWFAKRMKPEHREVWTEGRYVITDLLPFEFLLSVQGVAFCGYASSRGVTIEVDEPFLPRQLLEW